jgi:hypothetical protein
MDIKVSSVEKIFEDNRGESFHIFNDRSGNFMLGYRKAGSSSGRHYHTGKAAYKDPEILYLLSGEALLRWRKLEEKAVQEIEVKSPARIEIPVMIWHELVAVTDCSFWEMNSLEDVQKDSIRVEY